MYGIEITKREIIVSLLIIMIGVSLMIWGNYKIKDSYVGRNDIYKTADIYDTVQEFEYGLNGGTGYAFINAEIDTDERVLFPEFKNGDFIYIERIQQKYTQHTRTVTYKCGDSTCTRTETYWEWDTTDRAVIHVDNFYINGYQISWDELHKPWSKSLDIKEGNFIDMSASIYDDPIDGVSWTGYLDVEEDFLERKTRYKYDVITIDDITDGAMFVNFENTEMKSGENYYIAYNMSPEELSIEIQKSPTGWLIFMWGLGSIISIGLVVGFYYLDNAWLKEK